MLFFLLENTPFRLQYYTHKMYMNLLYNITYNHFIAYIFLLLYCIYVLLFIYVRIQFSYSYVYVVHNNNIIIYGTKYFFFTKDPSFFSLYKIYSTVFKWNNFYRYTFVKSSGGFLYSFESFCLYIQNAKCLYPFLNVEIERIHILLLLCLLNIYSL